MGGWGDDELCDQEEEKAPTPKSPKKEKPKKKEEPKPQEAPAAPVANTGAAPQPALAAT